jgi:hypothetical protein
MTIIEMMPTTEDLSFIHKENLRGLLKIAMKEINNNPSLYYLFDDVNVNVHYTNDAFYPLLLSLEQKCENLIKNDRYFYKKNGNYYVMLIMIEHIVVDGFESFKSNYEQFYAHAEEEEEVDYDTVD